MTYDAAIDAFRESTGYVPNLALDAWEKVWPKKLWPKKLWLYKDGDLCVDVTGGWEKFTYLTDYYSLDKFQVTFGPSFVTMTTDAKTTGAGAPFCGFLTKNKINLSPYKKIYATISMPEYLYLYDAMLYISTGRPSKDENIANVSPKSAPVSNYTMESDIYGEYTISFTAKETCTIYWYKIWLE